MKMTRKVTKKKPMTNINVPKKTDSVNQLQVYSFSF